MNETSSSLSLLERIEALAEEYATSNPPSSRRNFPPEAWEDEAIASALTRLAWAFRLQRDDASRGITTSAFWTNRDTTFRRNPRFDFGFKPDRWNMKEKRGFPLVTLPSNWQSILGELDALISTVDETSRRAQDATVRSLSEMLCVVRSVAQTFERPRPDGFVTSTLYARLASGAVAVSTMIEPWPLEGEKAICRRNVWYRAFNKATRRGAAFNDAKRAAELAVDSRPELALTSLDLVDEFGNEVAHG